MYPCIISIAYLRRRHRRVSSVVLMRPQVKRILRDFVSMTCILCSTSRVGKANHLETEKTETIAGGQEEKYAYPRFL